MNKFKQIVLEAMNDRKDLTIEFMIDHGINPSVFTKHIPLFDPKRNGLIVVQGADKESPYFDTDKDNRNKKCFAGDKLLIAPVKEERNQEFNFYTKDYGEVSSILVSDFMDTIYHNEKNQNTLDDLTFLYVDTPEEQDAVKTKYFANRKEQETQKSKEFKDWIEKNSIYLEDILHNDMLSNTIKNELLKKAYTQNKNGISIEDIDKYLISWWLYQIENKKVIKLIVDSIKKSNLEDVDKNKMIKAFNIELRHCCDDHMSQEKVLLHMIKWYKENKPEKVKESNISEARGYPKPKTKDPITDMHEVKQVLASIGIDPKFITVPITIEAKGEGVFGKPEEHVIIKKIDDRNNLDDKYGTVTIRNIDTNQLQQINIGELKNHIAKDINQNTELDTVEYRLKPGEQFKTLNPGYGKYIEIPEDIVIQMLKTVQDENPDLYPFDLIKYYKNETLEKPNRVVLDALQRYNTKNRNKVIRKFPNKNLNRFVYKGFVPYEDTGGKAIPAMGEKDFFKATMDL